MQSLTDVYSLVCRFGQSDVERGLGNSLCGVPKTGPGPNDIEDPAVTGTSEMAFLTPDFQTTRTEKCGNAGINRLGAHVPLRAYATEAEAKKARIKEGFTDHSNCRLLTPEGTR
eukprot:707262-Rhodomonas_salina.1